MSVLFQPTGECSAQKSATQETKTGLARFIGTTWVSRSCAGLLHVRFLCGWLGKRLGGVRQSLWSRQASHVPDHDSAGKGQGGGSSCCSSMPPSSNQHRFRARQNLPSDSYRTQTKSQSIVQQQSQREVNANAEVLMEWQRPKNGEETLSAPKISNNAYLLQVL